MWTMAENLKKLRQGYESGSPTGSTRKVKMHGKKKRNKDKETSIPASMSEIKEYDAIPQI